MGDFFEALVQQHLGWQNYELFLICKYLCQWWWWYWLWWWWYWLGWWNCSTLFVNGRNSAIGQCQIYLKIKLAEPSYSSPWAWLWAGDRDCKYCYYYHYHYYCHVFKIINVIHVVQLRRWVCRGFGAQFGRRARPCRLHAEASLIIFSIN